jgi:hypothetical protein
MTTKITQIAMFAVAAFALGGMVVAPAYADDQWTINYVNDTQTGQTATSSVDNDDCGDPFTTCGTYTKVYNNNPSDKVKVYYKVVTANCDVDINFYKNNVKQGSTYHAYNVTTGPGSYQIVTNSNFSISSTDDIRTETNFKNCTWP